MILVDNIKDFIEPYVTLDEPVLYKGLNIHPIFVKDWCKFMSACDILNIDKTQTNDIDIIQMSYLKYMLELILSDNVWKNKFLIILDLCFNIQFDEKYFLKDFDVDEILFTKKDEENSDIFINGYNVKFHLDGKVKANIVLDDKEFNATEFKEMIRIIMYQNFIDYDDTPMSDDFKEIIENFNRLKKNKIVEPSIEDKITVMMAKNGYTKNEIENLSYRKFEKMFNIIVGEDDYLIGSIAQIHGAKCDVEHWIYKNNKQKYSEMFKDLDEYKKKITI